eukprot:m51a1_g10565 hypothetical protein (1230) ;mRNA; r:21511-27448
MLGNNNAQPVPFKQLYDWTLEPRWGQPAVGAQFELTVHQNGGPGNARSGMSAFPGAGVPMFPGFEPSISVPPHQEQATVWFALANDQHVSVEGSLRFADIAYQGGPYEVQLLHDSSDAPWAVLRFFSRPADAELIRETHVYSLLVGADRNFRGSPLKGPRNDVRAMEHILEHRFHTRPEDGRTLLGTDASLAWITHRLEEMAGRAQRGDVVLFYFSGMGTTRREPPEYGVIPQHPTACLVPYDVFPAPLEEQQELRLLSSKEVVQLLDPAVQKGATVVLVLDCSFSKDSTADIHAIDPNATVRYLHLPCSLDPHERPHNEGAIDCFESVVDSYNSGYMVRSVRSVGAGGLPSDSTVGSVLDTLLVGAQQSAGAAAGECGRWGVIARGAQGFGAGIVEAASKATATRDVGAGERKAALDALGAVTGEQWAAVAAKAIALDPRGMRALVDRATGGLGASDSRRRQLLRRVSDSALSLLMGAAGDQEKLREAVQELPLQRKMELLEEAGQEMGEVEARPWVHVLSAMLAEAPDATRAALRQETIAEIEKLKAETETGLLGPQDRTRVLDVLASVTDECKSVLPTVAAKLGMQSGTLGDLLAIGSKTEMEAEHLSLLIREASQRTWCAAIRDAITSDERLKQRLDAQQYKRIEEGTASKTDLEWLRVLQAVALDDAVALQTVGNVLGRVVGRQVETAEISDSESEGLAQLARDVSDTIEVVQHSSARAQPSSTSLVPTDGNLCGLDSVHAFAAVRAVLDAAERILRRTGAGCKEDLWQDLPEPLDDGLWGGDGGADRGLRWQVGKTLRVDTRAAGVLEPLYSRSAGGLLFPASGTEGGGVEAAPASRGVEVVAHTAGYALLDALRPEWAEGMWERPEGGVLHEALADLVALLVPLGTPAVGGAVAAQTRCDVRAAGVAKRMARALADAVGGSAVRSASSTLTARDVWDVATGMMKTTGSGRLWSSRELSGMITSAVYGAVASELLRRCHGSGTAGGGRKESAKCGGAEDPAEVLSQLAKQALRVLIEACLEQSKDKAAPTLVEFCESLVLGVDSALQRHSAPGVLATESNAMQLQRSTTNKRQLSALKEQPTLTRAVRVAATGPAVRMCECIARVGSEAATAVECPASRELWAMLCSGAREALALAGDDVAAWERLEETWGAMERRAAGQRDFVDKRMWRAIVVEAAEEPTAEGCKASVEKMVLSLEYVTGCCKESASLRLWRKVLVAYRTAV